jgi:colicin import membrane protein
MSIAQERSEFAPPPTPGLVRALGLAILAHALLLVALTLGVQWKRDAPTVTAQAELWSAIPEEAAPPAPEPAPEPEPVKPPEPPQPPEPVAAPKPPPPAPDADIAVAREKARLQKEKQAKQDQITQQKQKLAQIQQDKLQKEKLQKEKLQKEKLQLEKDSKDKALKDKRLKEAKAAEETKKLALQREDNLRRIAGFAGAPSGNGDASSKGVAAQSSGPSPGYAGRIKALLKRNTTYTETVTGNPAAEVEVRTSPDGTIISRKLVKSSGIKSWDDAVLNAIDKTEVLPRDVDGRVPSPMVIVHSPNN